jgi:hypothetical protein
MKSPFSKQIFHLTGLLRWLPLLILLVWMMSTIGAREIKAQSGLEIVNIQANSSVVGQYEKFELTFEVLNTVATNLNFPYDPTPPPGVPAGVGITVEGLFTPDNWQTVLIQPGFLYQAYESQCIGDTPANGCKNGQNWLYPQGEPVWKVRFAPQQTGTWRYRLRVTDASGTVESNEAAFTVVPSGDPLNHGFIRISQTAPGYFEYSDGTPFLGIGHGSGFGNERFTFEVDEEMARFRENGVDFLRIWMSGSSIYMAPWNPWYSHHLPGEGGYLNPVSLTYAQAYADHRFSLRLWDYPDPSIENRRNPCMFQGFSNEIAVKPSTTYQIRVRLKTVNVSGPRDTRYPFGFTVRIAGWLGDTCADPAQTEGNSTRLLDHVNGSNDWTEISATFTTSPDQYFLDNLYLILENTTGGDVYLDEVSIREVVGGQPTGPEVLRKGRFAYHLYFDPLPSWQWDYLLERAAENGVTIRPVVLEKNDWIANHLDANGNPVGDYYDLDNNRFYAAPGTAVRRLHEYFWRYLIARWGYSRAVHSWELLNEGDPYNSNHYAMADAFGRFMDQYDPHGHLVTTSTWHSFPAFEFWANPTYSGVDYADIHEYACCGNRYGGWARNIGAPLQLEQRPAYVYGGRGASVYIPGDVQFNNAGSTPRSLVIRGQGEWIIRYRMKAQNFTGTCSFGIPNSLAGPRLLWILDDTQSSVVPPPAESGKSWLCTVPAGTYDWRTFDSRTTHDGQPAPLSERIILNDNDFHALSIHFQNGFGTGGSAWIDEVELISPDGRLVYLNGEFDPTVLYDDSAFMSSSLSLQIGGRNISGPGKPVTRGEVAIGDDTDYRGDEEHDQRLDTQGVWLHNFLWAQINPGGLYELYWDASNIRRYNLYFHFRAFRNFMEEIPLNSSLNNGHYTDLGATSSDPEVIVLGQADRHAYRGHLWARHRQYTWRNVINGISIPPVSGQIAIPDMVAGVYRVTWWNAWDGIPLSTQDVMHTGGNLILSIPAVYSQDIAAHFVRISDLPDSPFVISVLRFTPANQVVTSGDTVTYRVTFSEEVTGVDASDFSLSLLSVPGVNASISSVTPVNASTYDVTVDVTGIRNTANKRDGAIRLVMPNTATIQDVAGNPLSGLPYTGGEIYSVVEEQTFLDVPFSHSFWIWIERLFYNGITGGCSSTGYCPNNNVSRGHMAVFLLRGKYGAAYTPPPVGDSTGFNDVPITHPLAGWIKQLVVEGITSGCGGGNYCPNDPVTRGQMAVFLLRAEHGGVYMPPDVGVTTGFDDVPVTHPLAAWIKQLATEGISSGCGGGNYCPTDAVTRAQMAVFLIRTFKLP